MNLRVSQVSQAASGGSYVVKYDAEIELLDKSKDVQVQFVDVEGEQAYVEQARDSIRRGAEAALARHGLGANICVNHIYLHSVDFSTLHHDKFTAEAIQELLSNV